MLLHGFDIDIVIEVDYVLAIVVFNEDLHVDTKNGFGALELFRVLVDDLVELDLQFRLNLAYSIDRTHYHLIQQPIYHKLRFT